MCKHADFAVNSCGCVCRRQMKTETRLTSFCMAATQRSIRNRRRKTDVTRPSAIKNNVQQEMRIKKRVLEFHYWIHLQDQKKGRRKSRLKGNIWWVPQWWNGLEHRLLFSDGLRGMKHAVMLQRCDIFKAEWHLQSYCFTVNSFETFFFFWPYLYLLSSSC